MSMSVGSKEGRLAWWHSLSLSCLQREDQQLQKWVQVLMVTGAFPPVKSRGDQNDSMIMMCDIQWCISICHEVSVQDLFPLSLSLSFLYMSTWDLTLISIILAIWIMGQVANL